MTAATIRTVGAAIFMAVGGGRAPAADGDFWTYKPFRPGGGTNATSAADPDRADAPKAAGKKGLTELGKIYRRTGPTVARP